MSSIDIGGAFTIDGTSGTQALSIAAGAVDIFNIDTTGRTFYPNQIGFIAGMNTDPGWIAQPAGNTAQKYFNNTVYNVGGGYAAGRFTAPVAGLYLFHYCCYHNKASAVAGHYTIPIFYINGVNQPSSYQLSGYFQPTGYSYTPEAVDLYYLNAGDYVEANTNQAAAGIQAYRYYSIFSGMLVG